MNTVLAVVEILGRAHPGWDPVRRVARTKLVPSVMKPLVVIPPVNFTFVEPSFC